MVCHERRDKNRSREGKVEFGMVNGLGLLFLWGYGRGSG